VTTARGKGRATTGREVAADVVARVLGESSWIAPTLDRALARAALPAPEAARATDLSYGAVRALAAIDAEIDRHRPKKKPIEPFTHAVLAVSVAELASHPDRAHAIVSSAVGLVKRERGEGMARFVNAILRRVSSGPLALGARLRPAVRASIARGVGEARMAAVEASLALPPWLGLRAEIDRDALARRISEARAGAEVRLGALAPQAVLVRSAGDPRELPGYAEGAFGVQEEGSQLLALLAEARAGERVVDACAGHGGKTAVLARAVGEHGRVVALDLHEAKLARIAPELARLGLSRVPLETRAADLTVGVAGLAPRGFDRVLVDAPCTGLGTLARRPEIALRVGSDDPARLAKTQLAILTNAATLVKPGGGLVYAVCSPTQEEGAGVVRAFLDAHPGARLSAPPSADPDGIVRVGPWADPHLIADQYQAAVFTID
jgi:16S rRNA (cytosine967-C5)-methyltransferase